jgi:hypothetical protein
LAQRWWRRRALGGASLLLGCGLSLFTWGGWVAAEQPPAAAPADSTEPSSPVQPLQIPLDSDEQANPTVIIPDDRPAWVESKPVLEGDVHALAVKSDFHARDIDAWRALDTELVRGTKAYIGQYLGSSQAPLFFRYSLDEIKQRFLRPENVYSETVQVSFGPMHQVHALLQFPDEFRQELDTRWAQVVVSGRLVRTAGVGLAVLALLAILFGYFRADTATRGYYTRRLQFVAVAAILALIAAGVVFARTSMTWVQWLLM